MARILVTGIDGFTGRHLAPLLTEAGHEVHGIVQRPPPQPIAGVAALQIGDLTNAADVARAVEAVQPERVVHLAGIAFVANNDVGLTYGVNLIASRYLLEALARLRRPPGAVLLASSANVYGNAREGALDETVPPAPANDYAVSKLAMEQMARLYAARLPLVVCRPFNYTGVGQSESFLLPKIVAHLRRGEAAIELGNLDVARDFSDVRDICRSYAALLEAPAATGRTVNLCSGRAHTLRESLALAESIAGRRLEVRVNPALVRANEVRVLSGSRALLDALAPALPRPIALADTLRWMVEAA